MRTDTFVMRGKTESGEEEVLNFSGRKAGYAYRIIEFSLYPSTNIGGTEYELVGTITAGKTGVVPYQADFNDDGLIASTTYAQSATAQRGYFNTVVNDTFLITQNLILKVQDTGGTGHAVNWQCKFVPVKLTGSEEAVANYKQFIISDG